MFTENFEAVLLQELRFENDFLKLFRFQFFSSLRFCIVNFNKANGIVMGYNKHYTNLKIIFFIFVFLLFKQVLLIMGYGIILNFMALNL